MGAADALLEPRHLGRILRAQLINFLIAVFARRMREAGAKVPF